MINYGTGDAAKLAHGYDCKLVCDEFKLAALKSGHVGLWVRFIDLVII